MNCIKCELKRAAIRANCLSLLGWHPDEIAENLAKVYGACYGSIVMPDGTGRIERVNTVPPYVAYVVWEGK